MITGATMSLTSTAKRQVAEFDAASVAAHVTKVVPTGNVAPEGGVQTMLTPGQLSDAVAAG